MENSIEVRPATTISGNPMVEVRIGNVNCLLTVSQAKQFAMGILSVSEKTMLLDRLEETLTVAVGRGETERIMMAIESATQDER